VILAYQSLSKVGLTLTLLRHYVTVKKLVASVGGPQQLGGPGQWPVWPVVKTALSKHSGKLKDAATRCILRPVDAPERIRGRGSDPDPAGGAYSAAPDPLAGFGGRERGKGN